MRKQPPATQKWVLTRTWPCWHYGLTIPASRTVRDKLWSFMSLLFTIFVTFAWKDISLKGCSVWGVNVHMLASGNGDSWVHTTHSQACKHKGQFDDYYQKHLDFFMHFERVILLLEKYSKKIVDICHCLPIKTCFYKCHSSTNRE